MTILTGDSGLVSVGPLKTFDTTVSPRETLLASGSEISLPTADPGTNQVSFTIQSTDLPTITPLPLSTKYTAFLIVAGKNTSAGAATVTYSLYKTPSGGSSASVVTGQNQAGIAASNFWTQTHYRFFDVQVGDTLEVRLWANVAGVNLDYYSILILPTRMQLSRASCLIDVTYTIQDPLSLYTKGSPVSGSVQGILVQISGTSIFNINISANLVIPFLPYSSGTFFTGRSFWGDSQLSTTANTSATSRPTITRNQIFSKITFRELRL